PAKPHTNQKVQEVRQHHEISEGNSREKKKNRRKQEPCNRAPLMLIESRGYKEPNLVKDVRRGHHNSQINTEGNEQAQVAGRVRVNQMLLRDLGILQCHHNRLGEELHELLRN